MLSRLRPLGVAVIFEDRTYKLGETVDLTLELSPRRDIEVREGRVDLVCDTRDTKVVSVMIRRGPLNPGAKGRARHGHFSVPRQIKTSEWYRGQSSDVWGESWRSGPDSHGEGRRPFLLPPELRRETRKRRVAYVHSSVVYVRDERIPSGRTSTYNVRLDIEPEPPLYGWEGTVSWSLVATVDVVRARNIRARRRVNVTLG